MAVYIEKNSDLRFDFHYRTAIEKAVDMVMREYQVPSFLDVNVMIVTSDVIREINAQNRNIDQVTDVLSFPYFEFDSPGDFDKENPPWDEGDILGDIVLCADKVISQALEYGHSQKREMVFLTVHSMLHLLGYDHMEASDAEVMEAKQDEIMNKLGILR